MKNNLHNALTILASSNERLKKAKDQSLNENDWCFYKDDENVTDGKSHFPIYELSVAKKTTAQLKGLSEVPNWWDGDLNELRQKGLNKIVSKWGEKINTSKIQAKQVKKKPT